jgi:acetylornithine deacetylase/succinyl-diaminopimelate desuccinylase-like protein
MVLVSDTGMWARETPTVAIGRRGVVECQIDLCGPDRDIHSGTFGGAVPNPATEAARLVAALHDDDRRVAIPGFYDGVVALTQREREMIGELPFDESAWLRTAASHATLGEAGYTTLERVWARPTAEVNGIHSGYAGPGGKTVVPSSARIKLSFRLVAGQAVDAVRQQITGWVDTRLPPGIRHETIFWGDGCRASLTPPDHPALRCLVAAMGRAFAQEIRFTRQGGSGPDADLQDLLNVPTLFFGTSIPSDGWHSANEKVELDLLFKGAEIAAYLWEYLAQDWRSHPWPTSC